MLCIERWRVIEGETSVLTPDFFLKHKLFHMSVRIQTMYKAEMKVSLGALILSMCHNSLSVSSSVLTTPIPYTCKITLTLFSS